MLFLKRWFSFTEGDVEVATKPEKTVVHVRYNGIPAGFWTRTVHYDPWGSPYIEDPRYSYSILVLKSGGTMEGYLNENYQWKWKSGPDVVFGDRRLIDKGWFPPNSKENQDGI